VSTRIAGIPGVRIDRIDHHAWQEAYYISDGSRFTRINIAYNARGVIGSIMPIPRDEFGSEITDQLSDIKGLRVAAQNAVTAQGSQFTREVFNDFFPLFSEAVVSRGLQIIGVTEESWNLRVVLVSPTARGELAIYCDGKGNISKYRWIGSPPRDSSLQQGLKAAMADL
jgi:hypothetical protein